MKVQEFKKGQLVMLNPYGHAIEGRIKKQLNVGKSDFGDKCGKRCLAEWKINGRYSGVGLVFLNSHITLR